MTTPFVSTLRARHDPLRLGEPGGASVSLRVQMPEVWDAVRVDCSPGQSVLALKTLALEALFPEAETIEDFVVKLNGFEVLDEDVSIAQAGAKNGSTFLLTHRRRRPVR